MGFTGKSWVGKIMAARCVPPFRHSLGYIRRDQVGGATRVDRVGQVIGHTRPRPTRR
jgi:hypothetical protein